MAAELINLFVRGFALTMLLRLSWSIYQGQPGAWLTLGLSLVAGWLFLMYGLVDFEAHNSRKT